MRVDVNRVRVDAHEQLGAPVVAIEPRFEADRQEEQRHIGGDERRMIVGTVAAGEVRTHAIEAVARRRDLRVRVRDQRRPGLPCRGDTNPGGGDLGAQTPGQRFNRFASPVRFVQRGPHLGDAGGESRRPRSAPR